MTGLGCQPLLVGFFAYLQLNAFPADTKLDFVSAFKVHIFVRFPVFPGSAGG